LTSHRRITIETLLSCGAGQREIERRIGVDRKTIPRYARLAQSPGVASGAERDDGQTPHPGHRLNRPSSPARGKGGASRRAPVCGVICVARTGTRGRKVCQYAPFGVVRVWKVSGRWAVHDRAAAGLETWPVGLVHETARIQFDTRFGWSSGGVGGASGL
jgi:hypothetical protein